jgi:hypothetical protein
VNLVNSLCSSSPKEKRMVSSVVATRRVCRGTDALPGAPSQPPPFIIKFTSVAQTRRCRSTKYIVSFLRVLVLQQAEFGMRLHRIANCKPRLSSWRSETLRQDSMQRFFSPAVQRRLAPTFAISQRPSDANLDLSTYQALSGLSSFPLLAFV